MGIENAPCGAPPLPVPAYATTSYAPVGTAARSKDVFHGAVFGVLVALSGCLRGIQCGRSASAVGAAATSAVVTGIISIVVATAIITVICNVIGI